MTTMTFRRWAETPTVADVRIVGDQTFVQRGGRYVRTTPEEAAILSGSNRSVAIKSALAELHTMASSVAGLAFSSVGRGDIGESFFADAEAPAAQAQQIQEFARYGPQRR